MPKVSPEFASEVKRAADFDAAACMHCGICTAVCPLGREDLPRRLFRCVMMGMEDEVRKEIPTIYSCLLCRMCEENCPSKVHIAENIRFLRKWLNKKEFNV